MNSEKKSEKMTNMHYVKVYVDVMVVMKSDSSLKPVKLIWEGKAYEIDRYEGPFHRPPTFVGYSPCVRFNFFIKGLKKEVFLESEPRRWFVEMKKSRY